MTRFGSVALLMCSPSAASAAPDLSGTPSSVQLTAPETEPGFDLVVLGELVETGQPARPRLPDRAIPAVPKELTRALDAVTALRPSFVMTTGNLISAPRSVERWGQEADATIGALGELGAPWYPVPGVSSFVDAAGNTDPDRATMYAERFGPRWYAFEYHSALVVALDTNDPHTGAVTGEQIAWLGETLANSDATTLLIFTHRDLWNEPGDAWDRVHATLAGDRRPAAVFASSSRCYRSDGRRDSVSYYTLGPVVGRSSEPQSASYSWPHVTMVRVRGGEVTPVIIPTSPSADRPGVRAHDWQSGEEVDRVRALASGGWASVAGLVGATPNGSLDGTVVVRLTNPTDRRLPYSVSTATSVGASFSPDRVDGTLEPGESLEWNMSVLGGTVGRERPGDHVRVGVNYTMENGEVARLAQQMPIPMRLQVPDRLRARETDPGLATALELNGRSALESDAQLPETFTLECWVRGETPRERTALCSTLDLEGAGDGAGLYWMIDGEGNPMPAAIIRVGQMQAVLRSSEPWAWDRWGHLALTHDGEQATLFVNGKPVDTQALRGGLASTSGPLMLGAGPGENHPAMWFRGELDEIRLSRGARYAEPFTPAAALDADSSTVALYHFDAPDAPLGADASASESHAWEIGSPRRASRSVP